jgi:hypothetical protein
VTRDANGKYICDKGCGQLFDDMAGHTSHRLTCTGGSWRCQWCQCKESETTGRSAGPQGEGTLCDSCGSRYTGGR